ncbi:ANTAR domain-containing protein [Streptomyces sp. NBRC 110028]|uniref:ANTAR domain-containing protein n=1 Tax=Streptomyces sp. NBRC 110028 TaxID=1621260 RepID=UPI0006E1559E|nr:ANTAR domain-containing protein [Streptomyces sp. NBRC 110028]
MTDEDFPDDKVAALQEEVAALQEEVDQLRQAVISHAVIDQAIGVLIAVRGLRSDEGWNVLREVSQHTNIKVREIARHVLWWAHSGWLLPEIRPKLHAAVVNARRARREAEAAFRQDDRADGSGQPAGRGSPR